MQGRSLARRASTLCLWSRRARFAGGHRPGGGLVAPLGERRPRLSSGWSTSPGSRPYEGREGDQEQAAKLWYVTPSFGEENRAEWPVSSRRSRRATHQGSSPPAAARRTSTRCASRAVTRPSQGATQWRSFHGQTQGRDEPRRGQPPGGRTSTASPASCGSSIRIVLARVGADAQKALAHVEEILWYEGPQYARRSSRSRSRQQRPNRAADGS